MTLPDKPPFDRAAHCRKIGSLGGKATAEKHGSQHMREIGQEGGYALLEKYGLSFLKQIGSAGKAACIAKHGQDRWQYVAGHKKGTEDE